MSALSLHIVYRLYDSAIGRDVSIPEEISDLYKDDIMPCQLQVRADWGRSHTLIQDPFFPNVQSTITVY